MDNVIYSRNMLNAFITCFMYFNYKKVPGNLDYFSSCLPNGKLSEYLQPNSWNKQMGTDENYTVNSHYLDFAYLE